MEGWKESFAMKFCERWLSKEDRGGGEGREGEGVEDLPMNSCCFVLLKLLENKKMTLIQLRKSFQSSNTTPLIPSALSSTPSSSTTASSCDLSSTPVDEVMNPHSTLPSPIPTLALPYSDLLHSNSSSITDCNV